MCRQLGHHKAGKVVQDMGAYDRVPADGRHLNYAKFVKRGDQKLTQTPHGEH